MLEDQKPIVVSIACEDQQSALHIGQKLVENKLVACAQVFPIQSIFRWKGKVESAEEVLLQAKTVANQLKAIETLVLAEHTYQVPEIIACDISWGHQAYLDWIKEQTILAK